MSDEPVTILDAEKAQFAAAFCPYKDDTYKALYDVIDGRTVVIRKWTEAQCREAFNEWWPHGEVDPDEIWLACARALGAIVEDGK